MERFRQRSMRGSVMVESLWTLTACLLITLLVLWWWLIVVEKLVATYAMFMGIRAAAVTVTQPEAVAAAQVRAIDPHGAPGQRLEPPWRLGHVPQPVVSSEARGDNPL